jgi:hypothetical protein
MPLQYGAVTGWKIWYDSNDTYSSTYSSLDGKWSDAPRDGVICYSVFYTGKDPSGNSMRRIHSGEDWYFSDGDELFGANSDDYIISIKRYRNCIFLRGKWTGMQEHINTMELMMRERELV